MGREDRGQGDNVQEQAEALVREQQPWKAALPLILEYGGQALPGLGLMEGGPCC